MLVQLKIENHTTALAGEKNRKTMADSADAPSAMKKTKQPPLRGEGKEAGRLKRRPKTFRTALAGVEKEPSYLYSHLSQNNLPKEKPAA